MTGGQAYGFSVALISGLLLVILPLMLVLMRAPTAALRSSLIAGALGWAGSLVAATAVALLLPGDPLHEGVPVSDYAVLVGLAAGLAIMLSATGASLIALFRRLGLLPPGHARGTVAMMAACWLIVVAVFGYLALG